jgi:hypothetical protein
MARIKGSGSMGPTRSMRLPRALDEWFASRLEQNPQASPSEVLVSLVHGGLRLRDGYMAVHRRVLEHYLTTGQEAYYELYCRCLLDTFGPDYVDHLRRWLRSDGILPAASAASAASSNATAT